MAKTVVKDDKIVIRDPETGAEIDISSHVEAWQIISQAGDIRKLHLILHYDTERQIIDSPVLNGSRPDKVLDGLDGP